MPSCGGVFELGGAAGIKPPGVGDHRGSGSHGWDVFVVKNHGICWVEKKGSGEFGLRKDIEDFEVKLSFKAFSKGSWDQNQVQSIQKTPKHSEKTTVLEAFPADFPFGTVCLGRQGRSKGVGGDASELCLGFASGWGTVKPLEKDKRTYVASGLGLWATRTEAFFEMCWEMGWVFFRKSHRVFQLPLANHPTRTPQDSFLCSKGPPKKHQVLPRRSMTPEDRFFACFRLEKHSTAEVVLDLLFKAPTQGATINHRLLLLEVVHM